MPPVSSSRRERIAIAITSGADVLVARRRAHRLAAEVGFDERGQWEIAIAVSEAASNISKYTPGGVVTLLGHKDNHGASFFEFEALDDGDGIDDIPLALRDGVSQGRDLASYEGRDRPRSLGSGLGAIVRLMDKVSISNRVQGGLAIVARKDLR